MNKETGGPAFPAGSIRKSRERPFDQGSDFVVSERIDPAHTGMSLRDHFAGQALIGAFTSQDFTDELTFSEKAKWVYEMADAMLEARKS